MMMKRSVCLMILFMGSILVFRASACNLPLHSKSRDIPLIPQTVTNAYCKPAERFENFLLIRTAIKVEEPVYRIIAIQRDHHKTITSVKLFQFLSDGAPHHRQNGQRQDEILFKPNQSNFEAEVKGNKTTISFTQSDFQFKIHKWIGGLTIRQQLNRSGRAIVAGQATQLLLIETARQKRWRWVLNDGSLADFKSNRFEP